MTDIDTQWDRIEVWLSQNAPEILSSLAPGATDAEIGAVERELDIQFPEEVRESYRRHNGQLGDGHGGIVSGCLVNGHDLLSLANIRWHWRSWKQTLDDGVFEGVKSDPEDGVKSNWWNTKWIPVTHNGSADHLCLDLDPGPGGAMGQIITMWHNTYEREVIARSFGEWLEQFAQDLEEGYQVYSDQYDGIVSIDDTL